MALVRHNQFFDQLDICTSKIIRCRLTAALSIKPIYQAFWERQIPNYSFEWDNIMEKFVLYSNETKLITLNWKSLSNIYPTNILSKKNGKQTAAIVKNAIKKITWNTSFLTVKL